MSAYSRCGSNASSNTASESNSPPGLPPCPRCTSEASRRHDKKRWWCKYCRKPFTPGIRMCEVCKHVPTKDQRFGLWVCNGCNGTYPHGDYPLSPERNSQHWQILEEYSSLLLFGLRHPSDVTLYEQNAMQTLFQDLVNIHGNDAFARSLYEFLRHSDNNAILYQLNELVISTFETESVNCTA